MSKNNISDELIIETSAKLCNKVGLDNLSLKMIAEELNIKSPSLYNHISSLDEIKMRLMIYGWKQIEEKMLDSAWTSRVQPFNFDFTDSEMLTLIGDSLERMLPDDPNLHITLAEKSAAPWRQSFLS